MRLDNARERLEQSDAPIREITKVVGYRDPLYFSKEFKKKYGLSPMQYRQKYRKEH